METETHCTRGVGHALGQLDRLRLGTLLRSPLVAGVQLARMIGSLLGRLAEGHKANRLKSVRYRSRGLA
jgi:hypothetical protein